MKQKKKIEVLEGWLSKIASRRAEIATLNLLELADMPPQKRSAGRPSSIAPAVSHASLRDHRSSHPTGARSSAPASSPARVSSNPPPVLGPSRSSFPSSDKPRESKRSSSQPLKNVEIPAAAKVPSEAAAVLGQADQREETARKHTSSRPAPRISSQPPATPPQQRASSAEPYRESVPPVAPKTYDIPGEVFGISLQGQSTLSLEGQILAKESFTSILDRALRLRTS